MSRIARVRHNQILSGRLQLHSNSRQTSLKKRRLLPLSLCYGLQLSQRKKQREICAMEFRYQVIKAWSQVLIHPRETTLTSAPLRQGPRCEIHTQEKSFWCPEAAWIPPQKIFRIIWVCCTSGCRIR